jgi:hypothetical protein
MDERITNMEKVETNGSRTYALQLFLAGLATGIAVTALLAPSGAATRRLIGRGRRGRELDEGQGMRRRVSSRGAERWDRVKERLT